MKRLSQLLLLPLLTLAACTDAGTPGVPKADPSPAAKALALTADPGAAKSVLAAKADGAADSVVVEGRIHLITVGYAAFKLIDTALPYCGQKAAEDCPTPWDYCCDLPKIPEHLLTVEARGADGKPIATPALPDLRNLDLVKVKGKLVIDEHGNHALLATGIYRVDRPQLPDGLRWPQ